MVKTSTPATDKSVKDFMDAVDILQHAAASVNPKDTDFDSIEQRVLDQRLELREKFDADDKKLLGDLAKIRKAKRLLREAQSVGPVRPFVQSQPLSNSRPVSRLYRGSKILRKTMIADVLEKMYHESNNPEFETKDLYQMLHQVTGLKVNTALRQRVSQHLWSLQHDGVIAKGTDPHRGTWKWIGNATDVIPASTAEQVSAEGTPAETPTTMESVPTAETAPQPTESNVVPFPKPHKKRGRKPGSKNKPKK